MVACSSGEEEVAQVLHTGTTRSVPLISYLVLSLSAKDSTQLNSTQLFIPVGIRTAMTILRFVENLFLYFVVPPSGWDPIRRVVKGGLLIAQGETRRVTQDTTKVDNNGVLAYLQENNST